MPLLPINASSIDIDHIPRRLNSKMDLDLAHNVLTERDPNVASRTVDIPKQGKQTQDDMTEDTRTDLAEESTSMTSPTIVSTTWAVSLHVYDRSSLEILVEGGARAQEAEAGDQDHTRQDCKGGSGSPRSLPVRILLEIFFLLSRLVRHHLSTHH